MIIHIAFLLIYVFFIDFFSSSGFEPVSGQVVSIIFILHCLIGIYNEWKTKKISPLILFYVSAIIATYGNLALIDKAVNQSISSYYAYLVPENINMASVIWIIGTTFIFIGYELFKTVSLTDIGVEMKNPDKLRTLFFVMLLFSARSFFMSDLTFGSIATLLSAVSIMGIIYFARLWGKYEKITYRNYAIVLYVVQTYILLLYSYLRSDIILPTVAIFIGYYLGRGTIREIFTVRVVPFILIGIIFLNYFSVFGNSRADIGTGMQRFTHMNAMAESDNIYVEEKQSVIYRLSILPQVTNVVELVKKNGYYKGKATAPLAIALIPRVLWPEKPLIAIGAWFAVEIGQGREFEGWYNNSINMTIPGHLFLDFGWLGLCVGCLLMGGAFSALWNASGFNQSVFNITGTIFGGYLLIAAINGIGADLQIIITFFAFYILFWIAKRFI